MLQHILDAASTGGLYALIALGIALVFGVMGLINFAHGQLLMLGAYVIYLTQDEPWPVVVLATLAAVVAVALVMERVAFRPVRGADPTTMLITSFAVAIFIQNAVVLVAGRRPKGVDFGSSLAESVDIAGSRAPIVELVTIVVVVGLLVGLRLLLKRTRLGIQMRAAAEDFTASRLMGVRADRIIATTFALSGFLAAVAILLLIISIGTAGPTMGLQPVLVGFVATVIGGIGSLVGAAVGGFLLGSLTVALQAALPLTAAGYRDAFVFACVILVLLVRPRGLFASKALEERV